jgi:prevent-host-death family protein
MKHMSEIGIRALKQNASAVVSEAAGGEVVTITDRGRPVAQLGPMRQSRLQNLLESGQARPPRRKLSDIGPPEPGPSLSAELQALRDAERY